MKISVAQLKTRVSFPLFFIAPIIVMIIVSSCTGTTKTEESKMSTSDAVPAKVESAPMKIDTVKSDAQFLMDAAVINMEEIQTGRLAQKNGSMKDIKEMGKMMDTDHSKALKELQVLAAKKMVTLPTALPADKQADFDNLSKKTGKDFDKMYSDMMVDGHKGAIAKFQNEATSGVDADAKAWANSMLPSLKMHLDHAVKFKESLPRF